MVSKDTDGVKLILDGFYDNTSAFGTTSTFKDSTIDTLLNGTVLTWLNSDKIIYTNWNQGSTFAFGNPYTTSLTNSGESINRKVELIRIGEMLSGQSSTILTKNYTVASSYNNVKTYWTMTPNSASNAWSVSNYGYARNGGGVTLAYGVRPVIKVSSSSTITKGNGTWNSPYEI